VAVELLEEVVQEPIEGPIYYQATRVADEGPQFEVSEYRQMGEPMPGELV
jgi:lipopolysaccharide/colanic/teichoic acid biosynthesis glycosyltransferase